MLTTVEVSEAIKMALQSIRANKFRSFLTILGVLVGVSSVIALGAIVNGLQGAVDEEINAIGQNVIRITKWADDTDFDNLSEAERNREPISAGEARAITENCPTVTGVAPQNYRFKPGGNTAKYRDIVFDRPTLFGTWPDYVRVRSKELTEGRFISEVDEQFRAMVCVLGSTIAETLFEQTSPIGKVIRVNGHAFTVIGVLEEFQSNFGNDGENRAVILPLSTFEKLHPWEEELSLMVMARSYEVIEQAKEEIINTLRAYRGDRFGDPNSFGLSTQDNLRDEVGEITTYLYLAAVVITSVGLMVGGIGVMNIMLVSVTERTREIGVRKAIGAKRINIIIQFLTEAMTLSGFGGVIGVGLGVGLGLIVNNLLGYPVSVPVFWATLGFVVAVGVGLVSGIYPAIKASRLDPIESLRYE